ncbi:hypothetical protein GCM10007108_01830 [Thermogymnomonas acidicola]|uniref:Uncharacterized membrane protein Ta0354 soluble domain-containing protein n=1 Tax=Thermogymnomonas acidicola TaxID=399579 RepID=A0AA37BQ28_9ARCH|nr:DUF3198 domain-containing protein [Thermogymnomonas acidicola]GGM67391.1 hypothetical protein GCM10007108_01830 [Thermogymnomonas acidicola]
MTSKIREYQFQIYLALGVLGLILFIISSNDILFRSPYLDSVSLSYIGNWDYWVFAVGIIMACVFLYLTYKVARDTRWFQEILSGNSKSLFVKNLKELERISRYLGPRFEDELNLAKERWKVR